MAQAHTRDGGLRSECTTTGIDALVEVHTADELALASELAASLIVVTERDRATGQLVPGQAAALAPALPPDSLCFACGGIGRLDQVRTLRRVGYDGVVLGRVLGDSRGEQLLAAIGAEDDRDEVPATAPAVVGRGGAGDASFGFEGAIDGFEP